jgi:fibro-slime domain-containing protein
MNDDDTIMKPSFRSVIAGAALVIAAGLACSANKSIDAGLTGDDGTGTSGGSSGSSGRSGSGANGSGNTGGTVTVIPTPQSQPGCGNGMHDDGEECDDGKVDAKGNKVGGSGCSGNCRAEEGWTCPPAGACSPIVCGDGILTAEKECDDGNMLSGDGCSADCMIEPGWQCRVPGKKCVPLCGDGVLTGTEQCDDGNAMSGDGCSSTCEVEAGWSCTGTPSTCTKSQCGNGVVEAGEACDLGTNNGLFYGDGMGCSKTCTPEPKCRDGATTRACDTHCGDGNIDDGEQCDDGNQLNGDGCSSTCMTEPGFTCATMEKDDTSPCNSGTGNCLELPIICRDFDGQDQPTGHPDMFYYSSKQLCVPNASGRVVGTNGTCWDSDSVPLCQGVASATLNADGKPDVGTNTTCKCRFTDWDGTGPIGSTGTGVTQCSDSGGNSHNRIETTVKVVENATGSFKQWYTDSTFSDKVQGVLELLPIAGGSYQFSSSNGRTVNDDLHDIFMGVAIPATNGAPANTLSSGFFPLETPAAGATHGHKYCNLWEYWMPGLKTSCVTGGTGAPPQQWDPKGSYTAMMAGTGGPVKPVTGVMRNFYTTTEARYLFKYGGSLSLAFYGDDDVWVYINGHLALDLGAPHERLQGAVTVTGDAASWTIQTTDVNNNVTPALNGTGTVATLGGLQNGKIYEIAVFHADQHPRESNYQLTLQGFTTTESNCMPTCGDGVATAAEECDCGTDPTHLPDGCPTINMDGVYGGCDTMCHFGGWCGDGTLNGPEQCDNGTANNDSHYAKDCSMRGCTSTCTLAGCCGDGVINAADGEECDDGASNGTGRCHNDCSLEPPK